MLEKRIELLLCRPILRIELVNVVIRYVKGLHIPFRLDNPDVPVSDGMVQQPVTDKVYQLSLIHISAEQHRRPVSLT